jgi:hypothetical protein
MRVRLRQAVLVAADLTAAEQKIGRSLGLAVCYRDPQVAAFGLVNALFPIGDKLLEVVSPSRPGTTAGRLLDKRRGDGGYMLILQVDDLDEMRRRIAAEQVRIVFEAVAVGVIGLHLHPRDVGGTILSVDQTDRWDDWPWAGPSWREHGTVGNVRDITAVEIQANDPSSMAQRWGRILGRPVERHSIALDEGAIRFVAVADDRGEGMSAIDLAATDGKRSDLELCGCRVRID